MLLELATKLSFIDLLSLFVLVKTAYGEALKCATEETPNQSLISVLKANF